MKQLLVAVAIISLATTGCVHTSQLTRKNCGDGCRPARLNLGQLPQFCFEGGVLGKQKNSCDPGCGCEEISCGCADECCESSCGFPEECSDGCCDDCCDDPSCGLGQRLAGRVANGFCDRSKCYPPMYNAGPPVAQTAYPYYTTRGPRDFLQNNPPTIGPY